MTQAVVRAVAAIGAEITIRPASDLPVFVATGPTTIAIRAGAAMLVAGERLTFAAETPLSIAGALEAGQDYAILLGDADVPYVGKWLSTDEPVLGGFHYAPGGNASARAGGDNAPAINPLSIWDIGFRPACDDPRGMAYVAGVPGSEGVKPFWADIYLCASGHLAGGTSMFGATIADGGDPPSRDADNRFGRFDYATAQAVMAVHGKGLMSTAEFAAAAYGVTEKTACGRDPKVTGLDAARTSGCGLMQASGNLYVWGHDGDPDDPRASIFGGSWAGGDWAGSRFALVVSWPDYSYEWIGARGRSDHLQLG